MDLTREEIFVACEELALIGENVTGYAVREHLGRGSPRTTQKYAEEWKRKARNMANIKTVASATDAISEIILAYSESTAVAHQAELTRVSQQYLQDMDKAEKRASQSEAARDNALNLLNSQTSEIRDLRDRCTRLEKEQSSYDGRMHTLQRELDDAKRALRDSASIKHIPRF